MFAIDVLVSLSVRSHTAFVIAIAVLVSLRVRSHSAFVFAIAVLVSLSVRSHTAFVIAIAVLVSLSVCLSTQDPYLLGLSNSCINRCVYTLTTRFVMFPRIVV